MPLISFVLLTFNLLNPTELYKNFPTPKSNTIHKEGNSIYFTDSDHGLYKFNVLNKNQPKQVWFYKSKQILDITLKSPYIYAHSPSGLMVLLEFP